MRPMKCIGLLAAALVSVIAMPTKASASATTISFASLDKDHPYKLSGTLYLPENISAPVPAVVMIHGTAGIDSRGTLYRMPLVNAGIAVFEVYFRTGNYISTIDRPSPDTFVPAAFAALKELRKLPSIDPNRIGVMGFSMGGAITMRTAMEDNRKMWLGSEKGFAAHVAFYPVCKYLNAKIEQSSGMTGAPVIIFYGTDDAYGDGKAIPELKTLLQLKFHFNLITVEYAGATHAFNLNATPLSYFDPAAIGGRGYMAYDAKATEDSVPKAVAFLQTNLAAK
jgi:dienelactone hydrolase